MQISISNPEFSRFVEEQIKAGRFSTPAEVIEAGLERLMRDSQIEELDADDIAAIEESEQQIARGEDLDWRFVSVRRRGKFLGTYK